jgi:hypothetical protein
MSEWKARAVRRRDARHTKSPTEIPKARVANAKKDTKRWCRGKTGVEHSPKCVDYRGTKLAPSDFRGRPINPYEGWKLLVCATCGKELDRYCPRRGNDKQPRPAWAERSESESNGSAEAAPD